MTLDLTFREVRDFVDKRHPDMIDAVDGLLGVILVCSPVFLGPVAVPLLCLLAAKNELTKLGKGLFETLTRGDVGDFLAHQQRLEASYALISFTSFFEALDRNLPDPLRKRLQLSADEKQLILKGALDEKIIPSCPSGEMAQRPSERQPPFSVSFPHPAQDFDSLKADLRVLYARLSKGFLAFLEKLAVWDAMDTNEKEKLAEQLGKLPDIALTYFDQQYAELATQFEDFAVWANLQEHKHTRSLIAKLSAYVRQHAQLAGEASSKIDLGFDRLQETIRLMPQIANSARATEIVEALRKHYEARINDPIFADKSQADAKAHLQFPRIRDAFIPQSYRVIRQTTKARQLESEETWRQVPPRRDLGAFLLSYLSSPYSLESPLIILGHPGSGKSLLTKVLSATLLSDRYTPIRVALREVDSDASIPTQIEQYINAITADRIESWARLSAQFKNNPPVLILDGYDELLQASGKVFSGYLKDVRNFQKSEAEQGRPIRALVTSRLTLIDKASIPEGATIVRLLEFDKQQRDAWTAIWNSTNATYFSESDPAVEPFALPADADPKGKNVLSLAEQPLLLLMLALYDSEGNRLRHSQGIDRTALYDSLLRRFVARERGKDFDFERLPKSQQEQEIDRDMQRLGVAAIGMYNRRKLFIASPELDQDLRHFELERKVVVESGRPLSQADMLLGSFFFVHKSKLLQRTEMPDQYEEAAAFEFLHNTFGEFLTADFILRQALVESQLLTEFRSTDALRAELVRRLDRADAFSRAWFTCLIYTPLFSRPVVLEMLREWTRHSLRDKPVAYEPFLAALDEIVVNQIKRVLSRSHMPPAISGDMPGPFPRYPMLGHLAIYTLNLIILRTVLSDVYEFDESIIGSHEDGARPWDQLTHVWRSWFSMENLNGLAAILTAKRSGSKILLVPRDSFSIPTSSGRLETVLNVSRAVGDNVTAGLAGLSAYDAGSDNRLGLDRIDEALSSESIDVRTQLSLKRLIEAANETEFGKYDRLTDLASDVIERSFESGRVDELRQAIDLISARYPLLRVRARIFQHLGWNKAESAARRRPEILNEVFRLGQFRGRVLFVDDRAVLVRGLGNRSFSGEFQGAGFDWASMGASAFHERSQLAATEALFGQPPGDIGYPETIGELLHKGRLAKARRLPEGTAEKLISEIDKRGGINELARHRPDVLFEVITTLGKRDAERLLGELHGQWMEPLLTPSGFSELVDRRPPVAIELLRRLLGRVRPGVELPISRDSLRGLVRALLDPEAVAHFASVRPTVLHPMLRVLERGGAEFIDSEVRGKWGSAWQPGFVAVLLSTNPEVAVALLRLLRMILDNEAVRRFAEEVFRQQTDVRSLALQGYSPVCSEMLQLVREVGGERLLSRVAELLLDVYSRPGRKNTFFDRMPMGLAGELKRFAEAAGNATLSQVIVEGVAAVMRD